MPPSRGVAAEMLMLVTLAMGIDIKLGCKGKVLCEVLYDDHSCVAIVSKKGILG